MDTARVRHWKVLPLIKVDDAVLMDVSTHMANQRGITSNSMVFSFSSSK